MRDDLRAYADKVAAMTPEEFSAFRAERDAEERRQTRTRRIRRHRNVIPLRRRGEDGSAG